jgi:hypothetical protein
MSETREASQGHRNGAMTTDEMRQWATKATNVELRRALAKAASDIESAWSDNSRTFPVMRERVIMGEMRQRLSTK